MHELSVCRELVGLIEEVADTENARKVGRVWVEIGVFSHIDKEALTFCFSAVASGTVAQDARLLFVDSGCTGVCPCCAQEQAVKQRFEECLACGYFPVTVGGGEEIRLKSLEVL